MAQWCVRACHTGGPGFEARCGEACGDFFLAFQHWWLCISRGSHEHVNGGAVLLTLRGRKRTTENDKLLSSDHAQCPYTWIKYSMYMQGVVAVAIWPASLNREVSGADLGCCLALYAWASTSPIFAFSRPRSEWVSGWTVIACVFVCL